jgi:hypothetical protein
LSDISAEIANEFWWSKLGFWILVVGLAGEILVLRVPKTHETLEKVLTLLFVIVIIVGVTFEHNADSSVAELISKQEADAGVTIASLGKDAGASNERARSLEKETEELRAKNLAIEAQVAPRRIDKDCKDFSPSIKSFSGEVVRVDTYILDIDGGIVGWQIVGCLRSLGINADPEFSSVLPTGGFAVGVVVNGRNEPLVSAIKAALVKANIRVVDGPGLYEGNQRTSRASSPSNPAATVMVGIKPPIDMK